jgi:hypothetical protein
MEMSGQFHAVAPLPQEKSLWYPMDGWGEGVLLDPVWTIPP